MGLITKIQQKLQRWMPRWTAGEDLNSQQRALLRILATAHSEGMDPTRLIGNLAREYSDSYSARLDSLRRWLAAESSIAVALSHTPGVLNDEDTLAIECAVETDSLGQTYQYLLDAQERDKADSENLGGDVASSLFSTMAYISCIFLFVSLVVVVFIQWIAPSFIELFEDFGTEMPPAMEALVDFVDQAWTVILIILLLIAGLVLSLQFEDVSNTLARSWFAKRLTSFRQRNAAGILRLLAIATHNRQSISSVLTAAAHHHPDRQFRKDLLQVRTDTHTDKDVWKELASHKILSRHESSQIERLEDPSLCCWALEFVARKRRQTAYRRTNRILHTIQYVPILLLSLLIGWIVVAVVQTLTEMVTSLA